MHIVAGNGQATIRSIAASLRTGTTAATEHIAFGLLAFAIHWFSRASVHTASAAPFALLYSSMSLFAIASRMASSIDAACSVRSRKASGNRWCKEETAIRNSFTMSLITACATEGLAGLRSE
ncbi:hypothetical protein CK223_15680 [Mesorhizobium loti]|nr:hypothetical protein CK223_15680 [Mesorhizobium loti]